MTKPIFILLTMLTFFEDASLAQNRCSEIFFPSNYLNFNEMDSQKVLTKSWKTLFKSGDIAFYEYFSDKDVAFFLAESERVIKSLPPEVQQALQSYAELSGGYGGEYQGINSYLRKHVKGRPLTNRSMKPSEFSSSVAQKAKMIEEGIQQAPPLPKGLLLFRGVAIEASSVKVGEKFTDFGFISTSLQPRVAYEFARVSASNGRTPHLFVIELKSKTVRGMPLAEINEKEILLQRGLEMQVKKISERTMLVRRPGLQFDMDIEVPFRIVYLTIDGP
jgi:hypothetical protein